MVEQGRASIRGSVVPSPAVVHADVSLGKTLQIAQLRGLNVGPDEQIDLCMVAPPIRV